MNTWSHTSGKSWTKAELRKAEKTMSIIIENKDDIAKIVADLVLGRSEIKQKSGFLESNISNNDNLN